jgi:hypothetical protein
LAAVIKNIDKLACPSLNLNYFIGRLTMASHLRKLPLRVVIYPKDVENITGRSDRTARKLLQNIRNALGKPATSFVTVKEFCAFYGIDEELVYEFLGD